MRLQAGSLILITALVAACTAMPGAPSEAEPEEPSAVDVVLEATAPPSAAESPETPVETAPEISEPRPIDHFLPELSGYGDLEDATLLQAIEQLQASGLLEAEELPAAEEQQLIEDAAQGDGILACYAEAGAFDSRGYASQSQVFGLGLVGVVDQTRLSSLELIAKCMLAPQLEGALPFGEAGPPPDETIGLCQDKYEVEWQDHRFHVFYAGTTRKVCRELCEALEGCVDPYAAGSGAASGD